ncbi:FAD-binding oxidoreductase [Glutamicibacter halophytocola]|uniref:FAD-binding protein n=1 Tax=Glutamicibacter halophytocola TaxID=1933880 RepID=A0AA94XQW7_9MICC|nr:FAD-linked oxidase C-terminal domain-containing protein [Glutamicibacter halophytocola]NQD41340.1 FAD-binding protein [Glutamicibacter halophytocola]UUX58233.1 FAD-binding protein [Glutamicibacter halophytocola]
MESSSHLVLSAHPRASIDEQDRRQASVDRSGYVPESFADGVIFAQDIEDVVLAMKLAHEHRAVIVPRGAGTGLAAGSSAQAGQIVLDLSRMDQILEIDPVEATALVQPGVINAAVNQAAGEHGLFYAPDPASTAICSIGGNIATNAGGMWCAKYGVTRESVLSLLVVLPGGQLLRTGRRTIKGVAGYDMNALMIGSEGTLGIVVEALLRLRPKPKHTSTLVAYFPDEGTAAQAASAVIAQRLTPSVLELMCGKTLKAVDAALGTEHESCGGALLLAQTDGYGAQLEMQALQDAIAPLAGLIEIAKDQEQAEALIEARRQAIPSMELLGTASICDIGVPRNLLAEAFAGLQRIEEERGVSIFTIAHAADGNLHPIIVVPEGQSITSGPPKAALGDMFYLAKSLGGTLTGEHGIGLLKQDWLPEELGETSLELQRRVRAVFDPLGTLNPGKAI